jgi:hypothetical protein
MKQKNVEPLAESIEKAMGSLENPELICGRQEHGQDVRKTACDLRETIGPLIRLRETSDRQRRCLPGLTMLGEE